jgi:hypothetical protein
LKILLLILIAVTNIPLHASTPKVLPRDVLQVLNSADTAILYSLDPTIRSGTNKQTLYNFKILGQMHVDAKQMPVVADTFKNAVANFKGIAPNCFDPHHDLRIVSGGHIYDFLVCFKCSALVIYKDKKVTVSLGITSSPDVLDNLLKGSNIPLSRKS